MKAGLRKTFGKILSHESIHYFGNMTIGEGADCSMSAFEGFGFDGVLWATGAQGINWARIPGVESRGVYDSKELVFHYNGLPRFSERAMPLGDDLMVVGAGNVAVDISHWAVSQGVKRVTLWVRRGPNQVKYSSKEIGAIGGHVSRPALDQELDRMAPVLRELGEDPQELRQRMTDELGDKRIEGSDTEIFFRFASQIVSIESEESGQVSGVRGRENHLHMEGDRVTARAGEEGGLIPASSVVFCVGDAIERDIGLELNTSGGYAVTGEGEEGSYHLVGRPGWVAGGWSRVASDGLVGRARKDAVIAVAKLTELLATREKPGKSPEDMRAAVGEFIERKQLPVVQCNGVMRIRCEEERIAMERGLPDFRFATEKELLFWASKS
jgi:ferredoxin--NADP+ reductase